MRVEFASGSWADIRSQSELNAKDKTAMQEATLLSVDFVNPGATQITLAAMMRQQHAVMARLITAWSYEGRPIPRDDQSCDEDGYPTYDQSLMLMPIDDLNELEEAIQPHLEKLRGGPKGTAATTSGSNGSSKARASRTRKG